MSLKDIPGILLNTMCYCLSAVLKFFPRKKIMWAFGATGGFRDNPKYLYYEVIEKHPEIEPVWITQNRSDYKFLKNKGLPVNYWLSPIGLYHALKAAVYIVDHSTPCINRFLEGGAFYVNLWHGSSVKRVRWQNPEFYVKEYHLKDASEMRTSFFFRMRTYVNLFHKIDLLLAPSSIQLKEFFAPMMNVSEENCIVGIYPRSRLMIKGKEAAMDFITKYEPKKTKTFVEKLQQYKKTYIYMPTWRNDGRDFIEQAGIDWQRLNDIMGERNELFILKLHPFTELDLDSVAKYSNIMLYPKDSDVYTVLPFIDCLITDYSSIYTDFLMMNKEIILFVFDYEDYVKKSYELFEYDKYFVGKKTYTFNQLLQTITNEEDCHVPMEDYNRLMEFFWDNNRHNIDIVEEIKNRIGI